MAGAGELGGTEEYTRNSLVPENTGEPPEPSLSTRLARGDHIQKLL